MKPAVFFVLGATIAFVDAYPALCKGKYQYKQDDTAECSTCGICPPNADMQELEKKGFVRRECKDKSEKLPAGQLGQYAWCWLSNSMFPACPAWDDPNGEVKCRMGHYQMFVVYRPCWLECKPGFQPNASHGVECTDHLQWNDTRPHCIRDKETNEEAETSMNKPDNEDVRSHFVLLTVLGIVAFISVVVSGIVFFICWRRKLCTKKTQTRVSDTPRECTVEVDVQPSISRTSTGITVPPGTPLSVEARCSCRGQRHQVRHLMVVNVGPPPKLFGHFLSKGSSSPKVPLPSLSVGAEFAWIAQVMSRSSRIKEAREGSFSIKVDDTPREAASVDPEGDDKQRLLYDNAAAQNILGSEDMNNFNPTQCEDVEGMLAMKRLLEDKTMMERICRCLDREQSQGVCSWHHLATRLLGFQPQALSFIEYHLKGKLYEGPTSHVMRLLYQQGVSVSAFLNCLQQCSSSRDLVTGITDFLKVLPGSRPSGSLAFPELVQGFDSR